MNRPRATGRAPYEPLRAWERLAIGALLAVLVVFAGVTLWRSAYLSQRRTDADVYFRAAWALRTGQDPYAIADTNGWTYLYPPPLAVLAMPLAQEPPVSHPSGHDVPDTQRQAWSVPYPAAIVAWYALSAVLLLLSTHWMASALEACSPNRRVRFPTFRTRRWWVNRVGPALFCAAAIGSTLARGQVNILLLAGVCGACLLIARGRSLGAGLVLATAVCLKLFPAFLLLYALLTRGWRMLAGCVLGCIALLAVLPTVVLGPTRAWEVTRAFADTMLLPALGLGNNDAKADELARALNNQSLLAILHNWRDWRAATVHHAIHPNITDKALFGVIAGAFIGATIFAASRAGVLAGQSTVRARLLLLATLAALMLPLSPVCHNHYFALHLPLIACLMAGAMDRARTIDMSFTAWLGLGAYALASVLPRWPGLETTLKPAGIQAVAGLLLVALGLLSLSKERPTTWSGHLQRFSEPAL